MNIGKLGKIYEDGDCIFRRGDVAEDIYVLQHGRVDLVLEEGGRETTVFTLEPGDLFGQMALFRHGPRTTTAKVRGQSRVLTISRQTFLQRLHEDPSLAFQALKRLSERLDRANRQLIEAKQRPPADA